MKEPLLKAILYYNYFVLGYYTVANAAYLFLLGAAGWMIVANQLRLSYGKYQENMHPSTAPPVSVLLSAYNEEAAVVQSVKSLLGLNYPSYEIIVINDGSKDSTLERLKDGLKLKRTNIIYRHALPTAKVRGFYTNPETPNLIVVDKEHSGKSDSLNCGINVSSSPYFCSIDADSVIEKNALVQLMRPIIEEPDAVKATGGIVRILNGCTVKEGKVVNVALPGDSLSRLQIVEYIRSFLFGRAGLGALNLLLIISGTFSMFEKRTVIAAGGYNLDTVTEDMELVVRLHKHLLESGKKYRISFVPEPICWTEAPRDFKMLKRQRRRWHLGLAESLYKYRKMLFNPKYGRVAFFGLPYQLFIELLGPVIELLGYFVVAVSLYLGIIDIRFFGLFLFMAVCVGVFFSTGSVLLEEITFRRYPHFKDLFILLFYGVIENFGYRQINSLWRTHAVLKFLFAREKKWEYVKKTGVATEDA